MNVLDFAYFWFTNNHYFNNTKKSGNSMEQVTCTNCGANNMNNSRYCSQCGYELPKTKPENIETIIAPTKQVNQEKRKKLIGTIVGFIVFGIAYWGVQQMFFKQPSFNKEMMQVASELNKTCPIMVDDQTRLDNAVALPGNSFQYNYTLINLTKSEVNIDTIKKYLEPSIINNVRTNPGLKIYRDNKVTMIYYYKDKLGVFVHKLEVTPEMYQ